MNNKPTITIPAIPAEWIAHSGIIPAGNGLLTHVKTVLHKSTGYHPYVIHTASERQNAWSYGSGKYFLTLEEATKEYREMVGK